MERMTASQFPRELWALFDRYQHGGMSRRDFIEGAQKFTVSGMTGAALFEAMRPDYALAMEVQPNDPRIGIERVTVESPNGNGKITGLLARPNNDQKVGAILVVHENRGLNPYIEDVARRLAVAGYIAYAPDGLTSVGGNQGSDEANAAAFQKVNGQKMREDFYQAAMYLKKRPDATGKLGAVGFCFGGGVVNGLAVRMGEDLNAGVPFYGVQPNGPDARKVKAPINAQYAELDERITSGWRPFDGALTASGVPHEGHIYKGAMHGFHNDTTPRYDKAAATEAWQRTLDWFGKYVKG